MKQIEKLKELLEQVPDEFKGDIQKVITSLEYSKKKLGLNYNIDSLDPEDGSLALNGFVPQLKRRDDLSVISEGDHLTNNVLIEGDNMFTLQKMIDLGKKVDVIYIDPPYNTGNDDMGYEDARINKEDSFKHSKWLAFMEPRLKAARQVLSEDGVIFVSIDDNEHAYLKVLMDSIFGEENFVNNIIWEKKTRPSNRVSFGFSNNNEHILMYTKKNKPELIKDDLSDQGKSYYKNPDNDFRGDWRTKPLWSASNTNKEKELTLSDGTKLKKKWFINQDTLDNLYKDNLIYESSTGSISSKIFLSDVEGSVPKNILNSSIVGTTEGASGDLKSLFENDVVFLYSKPVKLIKYLLSKIPNKNATVLDFFGGTGTTGHAVLELNKEDGGNRQFILCTAKENSEAEPDKNIARDITRVRLEKVISGYTTPSGKVVTGIPANLTYFEMDRTELVEKDKITLMMIDEELEYQWAINDIIVDKGLSIVKSADGATLLRSVKGEQVLLLNELVSEYEEFEEIIDSTENDQDLVVYSVACSTSYLDSLRDRQTGKLDIYTLDSIDSPKYLK